MSFFAMGLGVGIGVGGGEVVTYPYPGGIEFVAPDSTEFLVEVSQAVADFSSNEVSILAPDGTVSVIVSMEEDEVIAECQC